MREREVERNDKLLQKGKEDREREGERERERERERKRELLGSTQDKSYVKQKSGKKGKKNSATVSCDVYQEPPPLLSTIPCCPIEEVLLASVNS